MYVYEILVMKCTQICSTAMCEALLTNSFIFSVVLSFIRLFSYKSCARIFYKKLCDFHHTSFCIHVNLKLRIAEI